MEVAFGVEGQTDDFSTRVNRADREQIQVGWVLRNQSVQVDRRSAMRPKERTRQSVCICWERDAADVVKVTDRETDASGVGRCVRVGLDGSNVLDKLFGGPEEGVSRSVARTRCADNVTAAVDVICEVPEVAEATARRRRRDPT